MKDSNDMSGMYGHGITYDDPSPTLAENPIVNMSFVIVLFLGGVIFLIWAIKKLSYTASTGWHKGKMDVENKEK